MTTRYTIAQLVAQAEADLPNNNTQAITPALLRAVLENFMAAMKPSFSAMVRDTNLVMALVVADPPLVVAPWNTIRSDDPPEMVPNLAAGTITHAVASLGNASALSRVTFYSGVSGPAGADLTFIIFANGVATDIVARISTTGVNNIVTVVLSGLDQRAVDVVYDVRVDTSVNGNFTFSNGLFRVENEPEAA